MRVCIFGAGAIGCYLAAHLGQLTGCQVSVIGRGANLDAIRRHGVRAITPQGEITARPVATDDAHALGAQDYVFITLKSHQVRQALDPLKLMIGSDTVVLPPTTGIPFWFFDGQHSPGRELRLPRVDPGSHYRAAIDPKRILGCVYWVPVEIVSPGVVRRHGNVNSFPVGEPDGSCSDRVRRLSDAMVASGLEAPVSADIRADIWMKMVSSLCWNPIAALTQATLGQITSTPVLLATAERIMVEADAMAAALGLTIAVPIAQRMRIAREAPLHKMSMLQDLELGRPLEFDVIRDSFQDLRQLSGSATPTLDLVLSLMDLRSKTLEGTRAFTTSG